MKKIFVAKVLVGFILFFNILSFSQAFSQSNDYSYNVGDSFSLNISTHLNGRTFLYSGYTEDETDLRTYRITNIEGDIVTWEMKSEFSYRDSDGGRLNIIDTYQFEINTFTRQYVNNSIDGPEINRNYYNFDYIWFRINPNSAISSELFILGNLYVVKERTSTNTDMFRVVDTLKTILKIKPTVTIQDSNHEYDPTGSFTLEILEDNYYFDQKSGYVIKNDWKANAKTTNGDFTWTETILLTKSSFDVRENFIASIQPIINFIILIVILLVLIYLYRKYQKKSWENQVNRGIGIITGTFSPPISRSNAPTVWDPLSVSYKLLLDNLEGSNNHGLGDGIFVITDTDSRLAIVDTRLSQQSQNKLFLFTDLNLIYFYQLALGLADPTSSQYTQAVKQYGINSSGFAVIDKQALSLFLNHPMANDEEYKEVAYLLARRRVLDYSHGQAPLSPSSHLRKLHEVLKFKPKDVLLVGDDDLLSISLAKRGIEVFVVEIDPYTCALIDGIAKINNLPVTIIQHDLREPFPKSFEREFDLFVADPDFTIEAFTLFLTRGLSKLKLYGKGLINFEKNRGQQYRANYLLNQLQIPIIEVISDKWNYVVLANKRVATGRVFTGKYTHVTYTDYVILKEPTFSSIMFQIERNDNTIILLNGTDQFTGLPESIYDY